MFNFFPSKPVLVAAMLCLLASTPAAATMQEFSQRIVSKCQQLGPLAIKKIAIGLREMGDCQQKLTEKLLASCDALSCSELTKIYQESFLARKGNVVGD